MVNNQPVCTLPLMDLPLKATTCHLASCSILVMGEQVQASETGDIAFRSEPTLEQYLHLAPIAGTWWPEHRARLLASARQAPWIVDPQGLLRIFLHEHLFDDAIAVLKTTTRSILVEQGVDAVKESMQYWKSSVLFTAFGSGGGT